MGKKSMSGNRESRKPKREKPPKLDFVRLGGEAQCLRHTYDAICRNILRFAVRRGALINVADP
ncbi:MAG: hypothetical protein AB7G25_04955, partial [Sphingomonadaceae bacterium]